MDNLQENELLRLNDTYNILQTIFDNLDALVMVSDLETSEVYFINKYVNDIYGNLSGKKLSPSDKSSLPFGICPTSRLIDREGKPQGVYVWETKSNINNRWYEAHEQAVTWTNGILVRLYIATDISNRKKDEKKLFTLMKQQELLSKVSFTFNSLEDFQIKVCKVIEMIGKSLDVSRVFVFENYESNKFARNTFEWCKEKILTKKEDFLNLNYSKYLFLKKLSATKGIINFKYIYDEIPPELSQKFTLHEIKSTLIVPIHLNKKFFGFIGFDECTRFRTWQKTEIDLLRTLASIISNAFERKLNEEAIIRNEQKLMEANATKDKFFSIIAHDLKNPIHNLINLSDILIENFETWDNSQTKEFIEYINESSKQGFNLLQNLLEWSRAQTGEIRCKPENIDVSRIIQSSLNLLNSSAKNKNIDLISEVNESTSVFADQNMITTVVRNLISNALKFTQNGGIVRITSKISAGFNEITISDTGIGIDEEDIPKLFRLDVSHSTLGTAQEKGTGLGLILCKEFIEKNKGKIWVESEIGKGSEFKFILPSSNS